MEQLQDTEKNITEYNNFLDNNLYKLLKTINPLLIGYVGILIFRYFFISSAGSHNTPAVINLFFMIPFFIIVYYAFIYALDKYILGKAKAGMISLAHSILIFTILFSIVLILFFNFKI